MSAHVSITLHYRRYFVRQCAQHQELYVVCTCDCDATRILSCALFYHSIVQNHGSKLTTQYILISLHHFHTHPWCVCVCVFLVWKQINACNLLSSPQLLLRSTYIVCYRLNECGEPSDNIYIIYVCNACDICRRSNVMYAAMLLHCTWWKVYTRTSAINKWEIHQNDFIFFCKRISRWLTQTVVKV